MVVIGNLPYSGHSENNSPWIKDLVNNYYNKIIILRETLATHLAWHGARLNFLALFLIALIRSGTVNLEKLAGAFRNEAKQASNYKRLQRFFKDYQWDEEEIAKLIVKMMNILLPWVLSVDRTTWSFGETTFNILVLGIVHKGITYPVVWEMLKKREIRKRMKE